MQTDTEDDVEESGADENYELLGKNHRITLDEHNDFYVFRVERPDGRNEKLSLTEREIEAVRMLILNTFG
jgi:hypothetical protein